MKFSRVKLGLAIGALTLAAAGLGVRSTGVSAATLYNLMPTPGGDASGMGFISVGGAGVQIDASGLTPNTNFRVYSCTNTGANYNCSYDVSGGIVNSSPAGEIHGSLAAGQAPGALDAYIVGATNDQNNQYIARVSGNPVPAAYIVPLPSPFVPAATPLVAPAVPTFVLATNCQFLPVFGFVANCAFIPGFGFGFLSTSFFGAVPGFGFSFFPGFGFFYVPAQFTSVGLSTLNGTVFLPLGTAMLPQAVCPAGFHGFLTVAFGAWGFPFGQFFASPFALPFGAATTQVFCP